MAYVRKTDEIYRHIRSSIEGMFRDRVQFAENWGNYGMSIDEFNALCWAEIMPADKEALVEQLGPKFFIKPDANSNVSAFIAADGDGIRYNLRVGPDRLMPAHWVNSYRVSDFLKITDSRVVAVAAARKKQLDAINNEQQTFVSKVKKIWDDVPSVNTFIKVWPPGLDLLSHSTREELAKPSSRSKMSDLSTTMDDINELNSNLLRAKVAV